MGLTAQRHLGASVWDTAVRVALPLTFALQWIIWSRHLSKGEGLGSPAARGPGRHRRPGRDRRSCWCPSATAAPSPAMLLVTWTSGTVLVSRGWGALYALVLAVGRTRARRPGMDPYSLLGGSALARWRPWAAIVTSGPASASGRVGQALVVGAIGAGLGALLVTDHTIGWGFRGAVPALALIPSALGGLSGGRYLSRVHVELPPPCAGLRCPGRRGRVRRAGPGDRGRVDIAPGSATEALVRVCVLVAPGTSGTVATSLFVGFGFLALATLLVSLLVSLGRLGWALLAVSVAVLFEVAVQLPPELAQPGSGLVSAQWWPR